MIGISETYTDYAIKPYVIIEHSHPYHLDEFILICRGIRHNFSLFHF